MLRVLPILLDPASTTLTTFDSGRMPLLSSCCDHTDWMIGTLASDISECRYSALQEFFATLDAGEEVNPQAWINRSNPAALQVHAVHVSDQTCSSISFQFHQGHRCKGWLPLGQCRRSGRPMLPIQKCDHDVPVSFGMIVLPQQPLPNA